MAETRAAEGELRASGAERWTTGTYAELRALAAGYLARERAAHTLAPTELVHEAWLKLRRSPSPDAASRVGLAAHAMREALVEHARRRAALKRGEGRAPRALEEVERAAHARDAYVVALDAALDQLAGVDPELARLVELRFFAGLDTEALAAALALSPRTVKRRWQLAKAWLHQQVAGSVAERDTDPG
jgi:RNA polymerase sigma factor (TIGR02999 family)